MFPTHTTAAAVLAVSCLSAAPLPAQQGARAGGEDPARAFFAAGGVVRVEITLQPEDRQRLREAPREYVPSTVRVDGGASWNGVGVKLKGAAGSFRKVDDRPGFTVNLGKFGGEARLHGLRRFHLNNGAQDQSRLCEWLGHEVFAAAGLPAPRVLHALVRLDGEDLGLYVLREGYDEQFLARAFGTADGNLYDGGFCRDIDSDLEKDAGDGPDDRADLHRLREACREFDPERPTRFLQVVDVDAMIDFCAVEALLGHWDGYSQNRNNFRLWIAAAPGGVRFLPHGMDQLLGDADASILGQPSGVVARTLMQRPEWRQRYRERLEELLPLLSPRRLGRRLEAASARIERALRDRAPDVAREHAAAARRLVDRLEARYRSLRQQVRAPEPAPLVFPGGRPVRLEEWRAAARTDHVDLEKKGYRGVAALQVICRERTGTALHGLFRTTVLLARGRYRLSAVARCEGVEAGGGEAIGVFLSADGARSALLAGNESWRPVEYEFEVAEPQRDVELALELRALQGRAWFRLDSLRLERLP